MLQPKLARMRLVSLLLMRLPMDNSEPQLDSGVADAAVVANVANVANTASPRLRRGRDTTWCAACGGAAER